MMNEVNPQLILSDQVCANKNRRTRDKSCLGGYDVAIERKLNEIHIFLNALTTG